MPTDTDHHQHTPEPVTRGLAVGGLLAIGLIHLLDSIGKYGETRYLFWMYVALMLGTLVVGAVLLHTGWRLAYAAAGALAASALIGYVLSRTTGLPSATGDIGNWKEPLGLASLWVEGCVVAVSAYGLALTRPVAAALGRQRRAEAPRPVAS